MPHFELKILPTNLLPEYEAQVNETTLGQYAVLKESELSAGSFSFYTSVAAVYSSKIEGEDIELDSYVKHKHLGIEFQPDYTRKIDDLYYAYQFAKTHPLNPQNIFAAHGIISKNLLPAPKQGQVRTSNMFVTTDDGRIEYVAALPHQVPQELEKFYQDVQVLLEAELSLMETFYFAALIHLVFVKIHPFDDGNGRTGRLIEKWFLGQKLGEKAWLINAERMYYQHHQTYYHNLRALGLEYENLDYNKALPFLLMLPKALHSIH